MPASATKALEQRQVTRAVAACLTAHRDGAGYPRLERGGEPGASCRRGRGEASGPRPGRRRPASTRAALDGRGELEQGGTGGRRPARRARSPAGRRRTIEERQGDLGRVPRIFAHGRRKRSITTLARSGPRQLRSRAVTRRRASLDGGVGGAADDSTNGGMRHDSCEYAKSPDRGGSSARDPAVEPGLGAPSCVAGATAGVEGPDALLDAPELPSGCSRCGRCWRRPEPLFLYVVVRHALRQADIDDRDLADYLAAMLLDFGRRDRAWRVDWNDDQRHRYLVDILMDLEASDGPRRFKVMVHLGNYALWLAGLFPDYIAARHLRKGGPDVGYYDALGRRGLRRWPRITAGRRVRPRQRVPRRRRAIPVGAHRPQRRERAGILSDALAAAADARAPRRAP